MYAVGRQDIGFNGEVMIHYLSDFFYRADILTSCSSSVRSDLLSTLSQAHKNFSWLGLPLTEWSFLG